MSTCSDVCLAGPGPGPDPIRGGEDLFLQQVRQYFLDHNANVAGAPAFSAVNVASPITAPLSNPVLMATPVTLVVDSEPVHVGSLDSSYVLTTQTEKDTIVGSLDTLPKSSTSKLSQDKIVESLDTLPKFSTSELSQDKIVESLDTLPKSSRSELPQDKIVESEACSVAESDPIDDVGSPFSADFYDPARVPETEPE